MIKKYFLFTLIFACFFLCDSPLLSKPGKKTGGNQKDTFMKWPGPEEFQFPAYNAPEWMRNAVIVEVPIRGFNHPDYDHPGKWESEYGNASYLSIIDRLDFLKEMGVNVICLYSIYNNTPGTNLYAISHHEANPDLGTIDDIKTLIDTAHKMGFHVISNTNHYGVDQSSPMIQQHPDWFIPQENHLYGQRVFDVSNPEVVKYIIDIHTWWCTELGLDGWRIDIAHETYRKYIWDPILQACHDRGKEILLATEGVHLDGHIRGAGWSVFPASLDMVSPLQSWEKPEAEYGSMKSFNKITPEDPYRVKDISSHNSKTPCAHNYDPDTCPREGAYQVKGSRFLFGHNLAFAPFVPWMMPGELFNATHLAVPGLLNHKLNGKMLHSYINWDDVEIHNDVVQDFKKIMTIRRENSDIFHNNWYETNLINVPFTSETSSEVIPYARYIPGEKAAIIIGNNSIEKDVMFNLDIPLDRLGFNGIKEFTVTDLWTGHIMKMKAEELKDIKLLVPKDRYPGGGVRVLLISA
ncbi:MAG: hypothetical protein IH594_09600 [Bacteroidales bacterium]|nr:hypothetical protein [Bacteroidales bacterium]